MPAAPARALAVCVALLLLAGCQAPIGPPGPAKRAALENNQAALVIARLNVTTLDPTANRKNATRSVRLRVINTADGAVEYINRSNDAEARADGWYYQVLPHGTYVVAATSRHETLASRYQFHIQPDDQTVSIGSFGVQTQVIPRSLGQAFDIVPGTSTYSSDFEPAAAHARALDVTTGAIEDRSAIPYDAPLATPIPSSHWPVNVLVTARDPWDGRPSLVAEGMGAGAGPGLAVLSAAPQVGANADPISLFVAGTMFVAGSALAAGGALVGGVVGGVEESAFHDIANAVRDHDPIGRFADKLAVAMTYNGDVIYDGPDAQPTPRDCNAVLYAELDRLRIVEVADTNKYCLELAVHVTLRDATSGDTIYDRVILSTNRLVQRPSVDHQRCVPSTHHATPIERDDFRPPGGAPRVTDEVDHAIDAVVRHVVTDLGAASR